MFRRFHTLALLAGGVLFAACGDSRDSTPTSPELQIGSGPPCSPSNVKKFAKALAGSTSPLYKLAQQFTSQNANSVFATNLFFDLAAEAAKLADEVTLTETQKSDLGNLLVQGIACANVVISDASYPGVSYVDEFSLAAGSTGMLEVRGRSNSAEENAEIFSHNVGEHGSAGVKPPAAGFAAWYGGRALFYGFPIIAFSDELRPTPEGVAFEIFTVRPAGNQLSGSLRGTVALCVVGDLSPAQFRIQKGATILPLGEDFALPCDVASFGSRGGNSPFGSVVAWLRRNLLPEPLYATSFLLNIKPPGSATTLSPLEVINPEGATLTYEPPPTTGAVSEGLGVTVHATGTGETNWEGLLIKIVAQDNNGHFVTVSPDTATTNALGIADFTTSTINKPGVYQLVAVTQPPGDAEGDPDAEGFAQDSVISGNFLRLPN